MMNSYKVRFRRFRKKPLNKRRMAKGSRKNKFTF